jgi:hypothetical protein
LPSFVRAAFKVKKRELRKAGLWLEEVVLPVRAWARHPAASIAKRNGVIVTL